MSDRVASLRERNAPCEAVESPPRTFSGSVERGRLAIAVAAIGAGVFVQFWPILRSDFQLEDFVHLYDLANYGLAKLLLAAPGGHSEITSSLVYVVFQALFGLEPSRWFVAVLALHVVNAALLLGLLRRVGCTLGVAFPLALAWALCPLHEENLAWIVTIGEVLIVAFALLLLCGMVDAARKGAPVSVGRSMGWWMLGLGAATSHAMGIGVAGTLWFAAACLLTGVCGRGRTTAILATLVPFFSVLYVMQHALHTHLYEMQAFHEGPYHALAFWPASEAAVRALRPAADLVAYAVAVLPFGITRAVDGTLANAGRWKNLPVPTLIFWARVFALAMLAALPWALWKRPPHVRRLAAVLAVFAIATYGTIAWGNELRVAGSPPAPLAAVSGIGIEALVPRYHYVGTLFVAALLALSIDGAATRGPGFRRAVPLGLLLLTAGTILRIPGARALAASSVANSRFLQPRAAVLRSLHAAARSATPGSVVYLPNNSLGGGLVGLKLPSFPGWSAFCVVFVSPDCVIEGRPIRFVEPDGALLDTIRAQAGTPISRLVVPPS